MKTVTFYLDFISPFAYLAFETLPSALEGLSYNVMYQPVFLGGILQHHGQLAPAEVPAKRAWTYRHVIWLARTHGVPLEFPASHPFRSLELLRAALGGGDGAGHIDEPTPNRFVCEAFFRHVWRGGADAADPQRLDALLAALRPTEVEVAPPTVEAVSDALGKQRLQRATEAAIARGVFGVPSFAVDDKLFWGLDAIPMLRSYLAASQADTGFALSDAEWHKVQDIPSAIAPRSSTRAGHSK